MVLLSQRERRDRKIAQRVEHSTKGILRITWTIASRPRGLWRRVYPVGLHRDCHGQHPLAVFVPDLDRNLADITLRQPVPPNLGCCPSCLVFGSVAAAGPPRP